VVDDNYFVLGLLCYHWLSFCGHESFLHRVFTWFLLIACFYFSVSCVYLCFHLPCTFDGWVPILDFYFRGFFFCNPIHEYKGEESNIELFICITIFLHLLIFTFVSLWMTKVHQGPTPTNAPVGHSTHGMGFIFSYSFNQSTFLGFWITSLFWGLFSLWTLTFILPSHLVTLLT